MKTLLAIVVTGLLHISAYSLDFKSLETIYSPAPRENLKTYFLNGIPFAALSSDSSYVLLFLETGTIVSNHYAKLWVLYQNLSVEPYLLEPLNHLRLSIKTTKKSYPGLIPIPPSQIIKSIDNEKNINMIFQAVGGALKTVASELAPEATVTSPSGAVYKIDDTQAGSKIIENTKTKMQSTSYMYEAFKNSVNNGLLRRNTISQDKGVTGNIYFHIGGVDLKNCTRITLFLTTKEGISEINFTPAQGE
jgi:hypothetical protein